MRVSLLYLCNMHYFLHFYVIFSWTFSLKKDLKKLKVFASYGEAVSFKNEKLYTEALE